MSCPPLFQPIRFLAACTLEGFVFQLPYLMFCRGDGVLLRFHGFPFMRIGEHVEYLIKYLYVRAWSQEGDMKKGTLFTENPFKLLTI